MFLLVFSNMCSQSSFPIFAQSQPSHQSCAVGKLRVGVISLTAPRDVSSQQFQIGTAGFRKMTQIGAIVIAKPHFQNGVLVKVF
jgi:hypothetical protein